MGGIKMRRSLIVFAVWMLCGVVHAQVAYVGEVTAGRVNIRAGSSTNYTILTVAEKGEQLVVTETKGKWLKIEAPGRCRVFISSKYVTSDGAVTGDRVQVRAKGSLKGERMCQLNKGDKVVIDRKVGNWYEIRIPENCYAWVYGKYVKKTGSVAQLRANEAQLAKTSSKFVKAEQLYREEIGKEKLEDWNIATVITLYHEVLQEVKDEQISATCAMRIEVLETRLKLQEEFIAFQAKYKEQEDRITELRAEYTRKIIEALNPEVPKFDAVGWVEPVGKIVGQPKTYKLIKGQEILYYLRSTDKTYDLEDYLWKQVGVRGAQFTSEGWEYPIIEVKEIELFSSGG